MNDAIRRARLRGVREAERILSILEVRRRLVATYERVDVFDALAWLDVRVVFRPLHGLQGAYIRDGRPGVMISTRRPTSVQRFTAAHELGHAVLDHEPSLDSPDVMARAASDRPSPLMSGFASHLQEIEADAFAGAFLLPIWLITRHARKQDWSRSALTDEDIVYQLALRCGASFQATVWALERNRLISPNDRARLLAVRPKAIKLRLGHMPPTADSRGDAWKLTPSDAGVDIAISRGDTVTIAMPGDEHSGNWLRDGGSTNRVVSVVVAAGDLLGSATDSPPRDLYLAVASGIESLRYLRGEMGRAITQQATFNLSVSDPESGLSRANRARMISDARNRRDRDAA